MDAKLKAKWLRALRGKKYRQTTGGLKTSLGFCCLGVLADIQGAKWINDRPVIKGDENSGPSFLEPRLAGGLSTSTQVSLARLNDKGADFKKIADHIERRIA